MRILQSGNNKICMKHQCSVNILYFDALHLPFPLSLSWLGTSKHVEHALEFSRRCPSLLACLVIPWLCGGWLDSLKRERWQNMAAVCQKVKCTSKSYKMLPNFDYFHMNLLPSLSHIQTPICSSSSNQQICILNFHLLI